MSEWGSTHAGPKSRALAIGARAGSPASGAVSPRRGAEEEPQLEDDEGGPAEGDGPFDRRHAAHPPAIAGSPSLPIAGPGTRSSRAVRSLSEFPITKMSERTIARAPTHGARRSPVHG